ncbi:hypothetical protein Q604_UNBC16844G0001, partial [human gut metagenome]
SEVVVHTKSNIKAITSTAVAPQINKVGTTTIDKATPERRDKRIPENKRPRLQRVIVASILSAVVTAVGAY